MERNHLLASIRQKYTAVHGVLHERGRRIWVASEARQLGRGGITLVGEALKMSHATIRRGLQEIESEHNESLPQERSRLPGGGRKKGSDQQPALKNPWTLSSNLQPKAIRCRRSGGQQKVPDGWQTNCNNKDSRLPNRRFAVCSTNVYLQNFAAPPLAVAARYWSSG
jgi:hypothetical protein